ncbi:MAG: ribosome biogenesis GTP-binding protein YihA/YsxC [Nitrospirales bacterium]|nr:YihA family ribosome biogenesis GTP-binding protein [Nitrospira sp.]MDR4500929.1 ribosome biogenesis GTP-binding protein YihA/YsxC [Nitrospirales bacterium]
MKIRSAEFIKSCVALDQCPKAVCPEIALLGRSNVGKSSALNCLLNRKGLAKVGKVPGKTQMINFFHVELADSQVRQLHFVDLPGYGYAKVPQSVRQAWGPMIETYLTSRHTLCGVVVFIDIRRVERSDEELLHWLKTLPYAMIVVATKLDKISTGKRREHLDRIRKGLSLLPHTELLPFSSYTQEGRAEVLCAIKNLIVANI